MRSDENRHILKRVTRRIHPFSQFYQEYEHDLTELRQAIDHLEARNQEWAAEVRELRGDDKPLQIVWPAEPDLIVNAKPVTQHKFELKGRKPTIAFIIPPADPGSGGHTTIFRFVRHLEGKGYPVTIFIHDPRAQKSAGEAPQLIREHFSPMKAELREGVEGIDEADIVFATLWTTVYPLVNSKAKNAKFYFVQDFEPWFEPVGSYQEFIELTYKFGLHGITAGGWLAEKLSADYGMECEFFNFGVDMDIYHDLKTKGRKDICFYARPGSPRRGFEMGTLVLQELQKRHPDLVIHCFGADISRYELPFTYVNHGVVDHKTLNEIYNQCRAGLVFSFTNMSLTPQEMLASGCVPVVNKADNNIKVFHSPYVEYVEPEVQKLVAACEKLLYDKPASYFSEAAKKQGSGKWENTWENVEAFMLKQATKK